MLVQLSINSNYLPIFSATLITEFWLNINLPDSLFNCPGFSVIRDDRSHSKGNGVLILYISTLKVIQFIPPIISACKYFDYLCIDAHDS